MSQERYGVFCWAELATPDEQGAQSFYGELFGWKAEQGQPEAGGYAMLKKDGQMVGGRYELKAEQKNMGIPPHWMTYVRVQSADETAQKISQSGGSIMMQPFDVMDYGRMAVAKDPAEGVFSIWEPKNHKGDEPKYQPGFACYNEMLTKNADRAGKFYSEVFGWKLDPVPMGNMTYLRILKDGKPIAGMYQIPPNAPAAMPSHWRLYFAVEDVDAASQKAKQLKGEILEPPTDIPGVGRYASLRDPQGAHFSIFKMNPSK